jgi:hypothetical protein
VCAVAAAELGAADFPFHNSVFTCRSIGDLDAGPLIVSMPHVRQVVFAHLLRFSKTLRHASLSHAAAVC